MQTLDHVVVRFAGDSGDGMQLTGSQFTTSTALAGNDLATLPDFPAEIRAPAGTLPGVSGYQIHFSSSDVFTPGDHADVLVAMNPAALKANIGDLRAGGLLIVNTDSFKQKDLDKAGYQVSPLEDHSLDRFQVISIDLTRLTRQAVEEIGLDTRSADRCKNLFALGMMYWLFDRPLDSTLNWLQKKFGARADLLEANRRALQAGWSYCEATEVFHERYHVPRFPTTSGLYRNIAGNTSTALGLVAAAHRSKLPLFYASYPITPASDVLHELAQLKRFGVITFQAEDEIAAISAAIGASYAGTLGVTCTSGPGMALKTEALGLATIAELPLVVIDVQRGGPPTGLPTKTEQADLL
ncbi:MAG: 2-oxoacid:acceptor oxidoreductase family protein [Candidatus Eisenbacteria bacterium]